MLAEEFLAAMEAARLLAFVLSRRQSLTVAFPFFMVNVATEPS